MDPHTHLDMPFMGTRSADDFTSGQSAALAGGTTFHVDFVIPQRTGAPAPPRCSCGRASRAEGEEEKEKEKGREREKQEEMQEGGALTRALEEWSAKAQRQAVMDYGFHMAVSEWSEQVEREMEEIVRRGEGRDILHTRAGAHPPHIPLSHGLLVSSVLACTQA